MDSQATSSAESFSHHYDKSISRRSVDWRDSGIEIDDDQQFNSIDAICDIDSTLISQSRGCCLIDGITYDADVDGDTILHLAVVGCTLDKVKDLIKICDLDAINNMMQTPMHVATMANRPEMVELLIFSGAKLNIHDRRGDTPLHLACQKGYKDIADTILNAIKSGSNSDGLTLKQQIEMTNFDGQTCLHTAALHDQSAIIELLVNKYEADVNCRDSRSGETIMHKAIGKFSVDLIAFILSLGKHCNQADYSGRMPLDMIRILRESRIDKFQVDKLVLTEKLVNERIQICVEQNGCCLMKKNVQSNDEILDSSSSSSDYSDSDSDMS